MITIRAIWCVDVKNYDTQFQLISFRSLTIVKKLLVKLDYCANVIGRRMLVKIIKANNAHIMF
jgi:hypothetical protein